MAVAFHLTQFTDRHQKLHENWQNAYGIAVAHGEQLNSATAKWLMN